MVKNSDGQTIFWIVFAVAIAGLVALLAGGVLPSSVQTRATGLFWPPSGIMGPGPDVQFPGGYPYLLDLGPEPQGPISLNSGIIRCPPGLPGCVDEPLPPPPPDTGSGRGPIVCVKAPCPFGLGGGGQQPSPNDPNKPGPQQPSSPVSSAGGDSTGGNCDKWIEIVNNDGTLERRCLNSQTKSQAQIDCEERGMDWVLEKGDPRGPAGKTCRFPKPGAKPKPESCSPGWVLDEGLGICKLDYSGGGPREVCPWVPGMLLPGDWKVGDPKVCVII